MSRPLTCAPGTEDTGGDAPWDDRRAVARARRADQAHRTSDRRRYIDPTTCERDFSNAEQEFMLAMHAYKQSSGRMFPTWSEVLEVLQGLGLRHVSTRDRPPVLAIRN